MLYFSYGIYNKIHTLYFYKNDYFIITTTVDVNNTISDSAGESYSYSSIINKKEIYLEVFKKEVREIYLGDRWSYFHPDISNFGLDLTPKQRIDSSTIKVWYHPKSATAFVISEPKYEKKFYADEILRRYLLEFIIFTIFPFYFFVRWMIEWVIVKLIRRKIKNTDENTI